MNVLTRLTTQAATRDEPTRLTSSGSGLGLVLGSYSKSIPPGGVMAIADAWATELLYVSDQPIFASSDTRIPEGTIVSTPGGPVTYIGA